MPNLLANIELSTAQSAPVAWADVLGLSAVVDVESPDSVILLLATIPLKSSSGEEAAEFRYAVGGVREGPFAHGQHKFTSAVGSADIGTFAYALTGLSGSQTFSIQWQRVLATLTLNTAKIRNFQIIEILPGDRLEVLDQVVEQSSAIDSAVAYAVVGGLTVTVPVVNAESVILMVGTLPMGLGDSTDRVASCQLADDGVVEGGEAIIYQDFVLEGTGLTSLMRAKTGISGNHDFSLQWKTELANSDGEVSLVDTRTLQVLEFLPAPFPRFEAKATSVTSVAATTHTIDTPVDVVSGELLIAFIVINNTFQDFDEAQFSGWTDSFIEIKDITIEGSAEISLGVAYKFSDGTEGADIEVDSVSDNEAAHAMYRFSRHDSAFPPEIGPDTDGAASTAPNPHPLTPSGGLPVKDFMYIALAAFENDVVALTGFPPNYGDNQTNHSQADGGTLGIATRKRTISSENPGAFTLDGSIQNLSNTLAIHPLPEPTIAVTGTATASMTEEDVIAGGKTIILTLTGPYTWQPAGFSFNLSRQRVLDGLNSALSSSTSLTLWNDEVRDKEVVTSVVRTSDTIITITLTASPLYNILTSDPLVIQETITVSVPGSMIPDWPNENDVVAQPDFTVDQSPVTCDVTGTADGSDETDIVAGGKTILLTLKQDSWTTPFGSTEQQAIIDGLTSAQSELLGWNNEVRDNLPTSAVVRTSSQLVTITLTAQAGYDISAPEVITATIPTVALTAGGAPVVATPDIDIVVGPIAADAGGTVSPISIESQIVTGGRTTIITLANDTWVASGAAFNAVRQAIIDGCTSAQSEATGWNAEVRDKLALGQVTRTSDTVVTIIWSSAPLYDITDNEVITVTVPAAAMVLSGSPVVATPTFTIFEVPIAIITGTVVPSVAEVDLVAGGQTIIITLIDDEWLAAGVPFDDSRQEIVDGITASTTQSNGWNQDIRDNIPPSNVIRTSDTKVTITLQAQGSYEIVDNETVTVTVPGSALSETPNDITGIPTFNTIATVTPGSKARDRRGGKHAEDIFDVNTPNVETFPVNKFD